MGFNCSSCDSTAQVFKSLLSSTNAWCSANQPHWYLATGKVQHTAVVWTCRFDQLLSHICQHSPATQWSAACARPGTPVFCTTASCSTHSTERSAASCSSKSPNEVDSSTL